MVKKVFNAVSVMELLPVWDRFLVSVFNYLDKKELISIRVTFPGSKRVKFLWGVFEYSHGKQLHFTFLCSPRALSRVLRSVERLHKGSLVHVK